MTDRLPIINRTQHLEGSLSTSSLLTHKMDITKKNPDDNKIQMTNRKINKIGEGWPERTVISLPFQQFTCLIWEHAPKDGCHHHC